MYNSYWSQRENQSHTPGVIKVNAEHTLYVEPNRAIVSIGIVTKDKELTIAQRQNQLISSKLLLSLEQNGIPKNHIQTSTYHIYPQYNFEDGVQTFAGYEVRQIFSVTIDTINKIGKIIDDAIKAGANTVENIQFINSDTSNVYQQSLAIAYKKAFQKAVTLANASGQKLVAQPKIISEKTYGKEIPYESNQFVKAASTEGTTVQTGQIAVTAGLIVEYSAY
jgi:uncharacterized protein